MTDITFPTTDNVADKGDDGRLLRGVLRENAVFSAISGTVLAIGSFGLDSWLGVNAWVLLVLGLGLFGYAVILWAGAGDPDTTSVTGRTAVAGDVAWVIGAAVLIAATDWLTRSGEITLALVSVPVALFAIGQIVGLRRL